MKKIFILTILTFFPKIILANGTEEGDHHNMMENMMEWNNWWPGFGWVSMILLWILIILGIIALVKLIIKK